jgi:5-(aminomethyl)-3-furanmethanol phosphate kinase
MTNQSIRVTKVGGSLLNLPDLSDRIQRWLDQQAPAQNILILGGGILVDAIRTESQGDDASDHWSCIAIMNALALTFASNVSAAQCITSPVNLAKSNSCYVFAPETWLRDHEPHLPGTRLPESWDVTSDSIAARLAICTGADELVLLKSADPPSRDLQELADAGYVDKFFPKLRGELAPWRMVNLRNNCRHSEGSSTT